MFEEGKPWYLPTADEIHAVAYGWMNVIYPSHKESDEEARVRLAKGHYFEFGEVIGMSTLGLVALIVRHFAIVGLVP